MKGADDNEITVGTSAPPNASEADIIRHLISTTPMREGCTWYLISTRWLNCWRRSVWWHGFPISPIVNPGPIQNGCLLEEDGDLKQFLGDMADYEAVSEVVWHTLHSWYSGGPEIPRPVICMPGLYGQIFRTVEVRPLKLLVLKSSDPAQCIRCCFSKVTTVGHLKRTMCAAMGLDPDNVRVWDYYKENWLKILSDDSQTLNSAQLVSNQEVMLDEKNPDGSWNPRGAPRSARWLQFQNYDFLHISQPTKTSS
ncbi:ubiquitin carboxyl-terminal hydrolase 4 [Pelomyxa schiedti]|nr:ubiquitin carboxyl-terminal hydrolase 4 [Pelomyxa schiedti]